MAYSAQVKAGIGAVRTALANAGFVRQSDQFKEHGKHAPSSNAPLLLVACSGGRDSLALAELAHTVGGMLGLRIGAVIVDHCLQTVSHEVAGRTATKLANIGLHPVIVRQVTVSSDLTSAEGIESAARAARYEALCTTAEESGASAILLAHTKNDQAETILIDLLRSSGTEVLAGMPAEFSLPGPNGAPVRFLRPILDLTRQQTTAICEQHGLDYWDDPTNGDSVPAGESLPLTAPLRSRIRHDVVPFLEQFGNVDIVQRLAAGAKIVQRDVDYLNQEAEQLFDETVTVNGTVDGLPTECEQPLNDPSATVLATIQTTRLQTAADALRYRVLAKVLYMCGVPVSAAKLDQLNDLIVNWHGQKPIKLTKTVLVRRLKHVIRLCKD